MSQPPQVLIVEARFYPDIADELLKGALQALDAAGAAHERLSVPGAFEIPAAIAMALESQRSQPSVPAFDGFLALGCIIRGETYHFEIVANESARALTQLAVSRRLALGNGVLTVETEAQALERADPSRGDKGGEAARAALALYALKRNIGAIT